MMIKTSSLINSITPELGDGGEVVNTVYLSVCGEFARSCGFPLGTLTSSHHTIASIWGLDSFVFLKCHRCECECVMNWQLLYGAICLTKCQLG